MLRAIGRLIRAHQEERVIQTSEQPASPFYIIADCRYRAVVVAANQACAKSVAAGLGCEVLKSDTVSFDEESAMLSSDVANPLTPRGLNCR